MDDENIIILFINRDENALVETLKAYGGLCRSIAMNILADESDVEECINDVLYVLWNNIPPEHPKPLRTYLCRIVKNTALQKLRYNKADKRSALETEISDELKESIAGPDSIEAEYDYYELRNYIQNFIKTLRKKDRDLFLMRYWLYMDINIISSALNISRSAVDKKLSRIRHKLKNYITERGYSL